IARIQVQPDIVSPLLEAEPLWRCRDIGLNLVRQVALRVAELQRGEPVAVERSIDVGGVRIEVLADHETRLTMRLLPLADERDIRGERKVAALYTLPGVMKGVAGRPHVRAAAGDGVSPGGRVERARARMTHFADIAVVLEASETQLTGRRLLRTGR